MTTQGPQRPFSDKRRLNNGNRDDNHVRYVKQRRSYKKECTVRVHDIPNRVFTAGLVIEAAERICGQNTVLAVVPSEDQKSYDVTTDTEENALKLTNGLEIGVKKFGVTFQFNDEIIVSILHLPAYIEDSEILEKLKSRGCEIKSEVYRHVHAQTQVADGTRYVRVKFPPGMISLSWSIRFETGHGPKYFRLVHNNQRALCNKCQSPFHKYRQCPNLICDGCDEQGHKIRECTAERCSRCKNLPMKCWCDPIDDGTCPYCKEKPCSCKCDLCKKKFDDCACGLDEHAADSLGTKRKHTDASYTECDAGVENDKEDAKLDEQQDDVTPDVISSEIDEMETDDENKTCNETGEDDKEEDEDKKQGVEKVVQIGNIQDGVDYQVESEESEVKVVENVDEQGKMVIQSDRNITEDIVCIDDAQDCTNGICKLIESNTVQIEVEVHRNNEGDLQYKESSGINNKDIVDKREMEIDSSPSVKNTGGGIDELDVFSLEENPNREESSHETVSVSSERQEQGQFQRRKKMKFHPNLSSGNSRVRSTPYNKKV